MATIGVAFLSATASVPFASVISGCEFYSDGEVQIFMDNNEEWKEENEGWVPFTENVVITRIKGSITLFK